MPKISIILPVFNAEPYILEAVDSILNQTFKDFECLIFDDGSTDGTSKIIQSYEDERIIYKRSENNAGYLNLLNEGLSVAKGKYIARMDADDISLPQRLEVQYSYLENNPDVGICGSWNEFFGSKNEINKRPETFEEIKYHLFFGCPLTHPTVMMRKAFIQKYGLRYDSNFYYAEDHDFFATAASYFKIVNLPQVLLKYRVHATQIGSAKWKEQYDVKSKIQAKMFSKTLVSLTKADKNWLETFFSEHSIPNKVWLQQVEEIKTRIIEDNKISSIYDQDILEKACTAIFQNKVGKNIYHYFLKHYYNQRKSNLSLYLSYLQEDLSFRKYLGLKLPLLLMIKCIVGHKKEKTF